MPAQAHDDVRVLTVDDDPDFLGLVERHLERIEPTLSVTAETNPTAALERVEAGDVDCIVSEYRFGDTDGIAFFRQVRERDAEIPFILFTAQGSEEVASEAISAGVTDYMQKQTGTDQYTVLANSIVNATEHYRTEQARRESEQRYRTLVETSHDAVFIYQDDALVSYNDRFLDVLGYTAADLPPVWDIVHPEDRDRLQRIARRRASGEDAPSRYDARVLTAGGDVRYLEFSVEPITCEGKYAVLGSVRDVTQRRRREERLETFASIVSHDLRNPISVIAGRLELVRDTADDENLDAISRAVDDMESLIDDLRELGSLGMPISDAERVDLAACANDAWKHVDQSGGTLTVAGDLPQVDGDPDRLATLFGELFENALRYGGEDVTISVEATDGGFVVADEGPGFPERDVDRVAEPGFTTDHERNGFGLTAVEWIAQAHDWSVDVGTDGGARVEIVF